FTLRLGLLDPGAQVEDPGLQAVLLALQLAGGLEERRPLLGRVPDARVLRPQLGRDQEAKRQQRDAERDLPARDGPQADDHGHDRPSADRDRAAASTTATTMIRTASANTIG